MTISNNFTEYYKTITNTELLNILDNPDDFQPQAVEAAGIELTNRQLSDEEIMAARQPLIARLEQKRKEKEKLKAVEDKIRLAGSSFIDTINPVQPGIPSTEKTIRFIAIVFTGIFLFQLFSEFQAIRFYLKGLARFPLDSLLYFLPLLFLPVAIFTFWKKKTYGWILMTVFVTFALVGVAWMLYQSIKWRPSGFASLDNMFPRPSLPGAILQLAFFSGVLFVLRRENTREVFHIDKRKMAATIIITALVSIGLIFREGLF